MDKVSAEILTETETEFASSYSYRIRLGRKIPLDKVPQYINKTTVMSFVKIIRTGLRIEGFVRL